MQRPEGLQVSLLEDVIHTLRVSEQAVSQSTQRSIVQADQLNERIKITRTGPLEYASFRYALLRGRSGSSSTLARLIPDRRHVSWTLRRVDSFAKIPFRPWSCCNRRTWTPDHDCSRKRLSSA
jgi:hypothetical protein